MGYNGMGKQGLRVCICDSGLLDRREGDEESVYALVGCTVCIRTSGGADVVMGIMGDEACQEGLRMRLWGIEGGWGG